MIALITIFVGIMIGMSLLTMILYIFFAQITVKKLRKNSKTRDFLGVEYVSGWDIINVAQALAFPLSWSLKIENSKLSFMHAKASLLLENTNIFDRILGCVFYWFMILTGLFGITIVILNYLGLLSD